MFTVAAAPFRMPKALTMGGGMRSWGWLMRKFSSDRSVCAPQYLSLGTWTSPKASVSVLVPAMVIDEAWKYLELLRLRNDVGGAREEEAEVAAAARPAARGVAHELLELSKEHVLRALVPFLGLATQLRAGPDAHILADESILVVVVALEM